MCANPPDRSLPGGAARVFLSSSDLTTSPGPDRRIYDIRNFASLFTIWTCEPRAAQIRRGPLQATSWHFANIPDHLYTGKRTKMNKTSTVRGSNSAGHSVGATRQVKFSVSKIQRGVAVCEHFDTHPLKFKSSNQRHFCRVSHSHRYCIDFGDFRTL